MRNDLNWILPPVEQFLDFNVPDVLPRTRGIRNNNPGNIKFNEHNRFLGLSHDKDGSFCRFTDMIYGVRAIIVIISNYRRRGIYSLREVINNWAPPTENLTNNYLNYVVDQYRTVYNEDTGEVYGLLPDDPWLIPADSIWSFRLYQLVRAICWYESRYELTISDYVRAHKMIDWSYVYSSVKDKK